MDHDFLPNLFFHITYIKLIIISSKNNLNNNLIKQIRNNVITNNKIIAEYYFCLVTVLFVVVRLFVFIRNIGYKNLTETLIFDVKYKLLQK